jgi:hypothetical protein
MLRKIADDDALPWNTSDDLTRAVKAFLDPVLAERSGTWDPNTWSWK